MSGERRHDTGSGVGNERLVDRRTYLRLAGAAAATTAAVGLAGEAGAAGPNFETTVNMVDAGADPTGTEPCDDVIDAHAGNDTLLYFPEGTYLIHGKNVQRDLHDFGMKGDGSDSTTFRPPDGTDTGWMYWANVRDVLFQGIALDHSAANTGPNFHIRARDGMHVSDVAVEGVHDTDANAFAFEVTDAGGTGTVERVRAPHGGVQTTSGDTGKKAIGCYVGVQCAGTLTFRNCVFERWPNNGIYASDAPGKIVVDGGTYRNNDIANVRVGGRHSVVKNATIVMDDARPGDLNYRGIWVQRGEDCTVRNCSIRLTDAPGGNSSGGVVVGKAAGGGHRIRDTHVEVDVDTRGVLAARPVDVPDGYAPLYDVTCTNVSVTGSASDHGAIEFYDRAACQVDSACLTGSGENRDGVRYVDCRIGVVHNSKFGVSGTPIVEERSRVVSYNNDTNFSGQC